MNAAGFRKIVETIMRTDGVSPHRFLVFFLRLLSLLYGAGVRLRGCLYKKGYLPKKRLPVMVISIGNITVGGTGKTPLVVYLGRRLSGMGYRVAVVSRGYKGRACRTGGIVSDGGTIYLTVEESGDEPRLMAMTLDNIPVLVGKDRFRAGLTAVRNHRPDILLLDDAFQHLKLRRDLDIVLLDAGKPFGNGYLFPRGVLREPLAALSRGDAFILTRRNPESRGGDEVVGKWIGEKPVFHCRRRSCVHAVFTADGACLQPGGGHGITEAALIKPYHGVDVLGFSGIAGNDDLRKSIEQMGFTLAGFLEFDDHHWYTGSDIRTISNTVADSGAHALVTTLKDMVRIHSSVKWPVDLIVLDIRIEFIGDRFDRYLKAEIDGYFMKAGHSAG